MKQTIVRFLTIGITVLVLLFTGNADAKTLTLNASGGTDYTKIQDAVNASSSGDTIQVESGIYYENVNVNKQLILRGIGMPVVDARGSGSAITLAADGIKLEGFTSIGGGYYYPEAGIEVISNNNTLSGNNASNNDNKGIYFMESSSNNTLISNNVSNNRYGIYLRSSSNNTLSGNNANSNNNTGIYLLFSSNNTLSGNMMTGNQENFYLDGTDSHFDNHIDTSNLVDGRSIYYIIKASDTTYLRSTLESYIVLAV